MVCVLTFTQSSFLLGRSALPHRSSSWTLMLCFSGDLTMLLKPTQPLGYMAAMSEERLARKSEPAASRK